MYQRPTVCVTIYIKIFYLISHIPTAVIYTDTLQTVIMLAGASIVAGKSMVRIGGWSGKSLYGHHVLNMFLIIILIINILLIC